MSQIYLLLRSFEPNTAVSNRLLGYINALSDSGISATVCFFWPSKNKDIVDKKINNIRFNYYWKGLPQGIFSKYISYIIAIYRFIFQLKRGDVVYVYGMQDILRFLLRKNGVKVFHEITEHPTIYKLGTRLHHVSLVEYMSICQKLDGLFVISTKLKRFFIENGVKEDKITISNMFVDASRFAGLCKSGKKTRYIAYCGTVSNNKDGVDRLIKAFSKVVKFYPDIKLYIIGSTPSLKENCENIKLINSLGLKDSVVLTGVVSSGEMPQLLKDASILALSRPDNIQAQFGFPTKLGEYLLTENPVVLTDVGDISLFLKDGESALICNPNDLNEFAQKLCWAIENPTESSIIGRNGAKIAKESFNNVVETQKLIRKMIPSYRKL